MALRGSLERLPVSLTQRVQEIRLRAGAPLMLSTPDGEWMVTTGGEATQRERSDFLICTQMLVEECVLSLCEYSLHTHQQELRQGFVTAPGGYRAGIAGTGIVEGGQVVSVRQITSVCLRVARRHDGCSVSLGPIIADRGRLLSTLICGEPSSGKSSLLKDLARRLSMGLIDSRRYRVAVVDERGELSGDGSLLYCDVVKNVPKAAGIQQAVRCLAPDIVLFDELGTADEVKAVLEGLHSGVAAVTTAHANAQTVLARPQLALALNAGAFERVVFMEGRRAPGVLSGMVEAGDLLAQMDRTVFGDHGGKRHRDLCFDRAEAAGWCS